VAPRQKKTPDPQKLVRSGLFALKKKKWSKARRKLEAALRNEEFQQGSEGAMVWANYGVALTNLNSLAEALEAFTNAAKLDKKNAEIWIKKGLIEFQLKKYNDSRSSFEKAKRLDKKNPEILIFQSKIYSKQESFKKAIKLLEEGIRKFPSFPKFPIELARLWLNQDEPDRAVKVLEEAITSTSHPDPGLLLGQLFLDKREYESALVIYEKLLTRFPDLPHAQYGVGIALHSLERWQEALDAYQKAIPFFRPKKPPQSLYINIARILKNLNRKRGAIDYLYKAKRHGKTSLEITLLLSELFLEIKRPDRAKNALEDAAKLDKENPVIRFYLGMTSLQLEDIQSAKEYFQSSLGLDPDFHESKIQLALIALQEKNLLEAFSLTHDVATNAPDYLPAQRLTAAIAFDLRKFQTVVDLLEPLVQKMPSIQSKELELLIKSWIALNKPEKAKTFLTKLLEENPSLKNQIETNDLLSQLIQRNNL